jgi:hypothetical protein
MMIFFLMSFNEMLFGHKANIIIEADCQQLNRSLFYQSSGYFLRLANILELHLCSITILLSINMPVTQSGHLLWSQYYGNNMA